MWKNWVVQQAKDHWPENPTVYIGCMTGTSVDCQADFTAAVFDEKTGQPCAYFNQTVALPKALQVRLNQLSKTPAHQLTLPARSQAQAALSQFLVSAYQEVIEAAGLSQYPREAIVLSPHGQAIDHKPLANPAYTDIVVTGEYVAYHTGCRVVTRHRQGPLAVSLAAPLAPVLIKHLFYNEQVSTVVVNGGGMANICVLPRGQPDTVLAYDTGPANGPLDEFVHYALETAEPVIPGDLKARIKSKRFDAGGRWAARGQVEASLMERLLSHPYFSYPAQAKSVDRASFGLDWVLGSDPLSVDQPGRWADRLATVVEVVVSQVVRALVDSVDKAERVRLIIYGGLASNRYAMTRLNAQLNQADCFAFDVVDMKTLGYDPDFFESLLMAYLGYCAVNHRLIDLRYCQREGSQAFPKAIPGVVAFPPQLCYKTDSFSN